MLKKHRKKYAQIKEHRKKEKESITPSKLKERGESQSKECLEKQKNIPHTCTYRSSCTSFFLDLVFGSTISCDTSEPHTYPTQSSTYKP
jgi:hypothetical protein